MQKIFVIFSWFFCLSNSASFDKQLRSNIELNECLKKAARIAIANYNFGGENLFFYPYRMMGYRGKLGIIDFFVRIEALNLSIKIEEQHLMFAFNDKLDKLVKLRLSVHSSLNNRREKL